MTNTKKRTHTRLYLYGLLACACLTGLLTFSCRNFFHELIPLQENKVLSFSVPGQLGNAIITEDTITFTAGPDVSLASLVPIIQVSEQATVIPVTGEYFAVAFPHADILHLMSEMFSVKDLAAWALDIIGQNPDFKAPSLTIPVNFRNPVTLAVISGAGQVRFYTVSGTAAGGTAGNVLLGDFGFSKYANPELMSNTVIQRNETAKTITATAVYPAELGKTAYELIPFFEATDGASVSLRTGASGWTPLVSEQTPCPFTPVPGSYGQTFVTGKADAELKVTASTGTGTQTETIYALTVYFAEDPSTVRSISDFRFMRPPLGLNQDIASSVVCTITDDVYSGTITAEIPYEGDVPPFLLTPSFVTPGTVAIGGIEQSILSPSAQDFSREQTYVCTSRDGQFRRVYTVRLSFVKREATQALISDFFFSTQENGELTGKALGIIDEDAGIIRVSAGYSGVTSPAQLIPSFSATGPVTVRGIRQDSGYSAQDFSSAVTYTVVSSDGSKRKTYRVEILFISDAASECELLAFGFSPGDNPGLPKDAAGTVAKRNGTVYVPLPAGTGSDVRPLVPYFTVSGSSTVTINGKKAESGRTSVACNAPLSVRVTSANGRYSKDYAVTVRESGGTIYVDESAAGRNDGSSWQDAFISADAAFEYVYGLSANVPIEIWIAGDIRVTARFGLRLRPNLTVRGGFTGGESDESERTEGARSAVSGDGSYLFRGNDLTGSIIMESLKYMVDMYGILARFVGSGAGNSFEMDNCETIVRKKVQNTLPVFQIQPARDYRLDMATIRRSVFTVMDVSSCAYYIYANEIVIEDCRFTETVRAEDSGYPNPIVLIETYGRGDSVIRNCEFNRIQGREALSVRGRSNLSMENVRFTECKTNYFVVFLSALENAVYDVSDCTFTSCVFGSSVLCISGFDTSISLVNCKFNDLKGENFGVHIFAQTVFISDCKFTGVKLQRDVGDGFLSGVLHIEASTNTMVNDCLFANCTARDVLAVACWWDDSSIDISRCRFENNNISWHQMYFNIKSGRAQINNCTFLPVTARDIGLTRGDNPGSGTTEFTFIGQFPPLPMQLYLYDTEGIIINGFN